MQFVSIATIIAERAAAALKESRRQRRQQDIGIPTWTGRSGAVGAPRFGNNHHKNTSPLPNAKFGSGSVSGFKGRRDVGNTKLSSGALLAKMRERRAMDELDISSSNNNVQGKYTYLRIKIILKNSFFFKTYHQLPYLIIQLKKV